MRRRVVIYCALVLVSCFAASMPSVTPALKARSATAEFPTTCNPFGPLKSHRPLDDTCDLEGDPNGDAPHKLQDRAKNNLCASKNVAAPALVTSISFMKLQVLVDANPTFHYGQRESLPPTRDAALKNIYTTSEGDTIGEGAYVQFVAYLLEGHFGGDETVNCHATDRQDVDIHLALVTQKPSSMDLTDYNSECQSVTAELIPHFRPIDWDILGRMTGTGAGMKLTGAQPKIEDEDLKRPLRFRGQLMFDASHKICGQSGRSGGNPARKAGWEIHPVYSIDVCENTTLAACKIDQENHWTPLNKWLKSDGSSD